LYIALLLLVSVAIVVWWLGRVDAQLKLKRSQFQHVTQATPTHVPIAHETISQLEPGNLTNAGGSVCSFGSVGWDDPAFLRTEVRSFAAAFHEQRKVFSKENDGGNTIQHSFAIWVVVRQLRPKLIVESGILNGAALAATAPSAAAFLLLLLLLP
jgi:hypothetical protein